MPCLPRARAALIATILVPAVAAASLSDVFHNPRFAHLGLAPLAPALADVVASTYPVASASSSVEFVYNPVLDVIVRRPGVLGPILGERAETLGPGRFELDVGYSFVHLATINGEPLDDLVNVPVLKGRVLFFPVPGGIELRDGRRTTILPVRVGLDMDVSAHIFTPSFTYGVTRDLDLNVTLPLLRTALDVATRTRVPDPRIQEFSLPPGDPAAGTVTQEAGVGAEAHTRIAFSPDNRRMAFTDLASGPDGVETEQLFAIELATGERRQVTHLTAGGTAPRPGRKIIDDFNFVTPTTLIFVHLMEDDRQAKLIELDGTGLRLQRVPGLSLDGGSHIVQTIQRSRLHFSVLNVSVPGPPANADVLPYWGPPTDVFSHVGNRYLIQLTNYQYGDTIALSARRNAILFMASADPLGANPLHNCQLFRISPLGLGLHQATHFGQGRRSEEGCQFGALAGCGIRDPFGTNPNGSQVFGVRWNGSGLRQLTHTRGVTTAADGSVVEVEIPGPVARGGR